VRDPTRAVTRQNGPVMDEFAVQRFVGALALIALAGAVVLAVARPLRHRVVPAASLVESFGHFRFEAALAVAAVATAGSLYMSEVLGYPPCRLCWVQRGFMYPLVVVLALAAWRRATRVRWFVVPWAAAGLAVSTYHYLLEWFPEQLETNVCAVENPCFALPFPRVFGFMTLAFMAGAGFLFIISVLVLPLDSRRSA
jgi:disulfide bond formation protein DsbB